MNQPYSVALVSAIGRTNETIIAVVKNADAIVIGRTDKADLPELELYELDVKIDTGAYTSSIHCHEIVEIEANGKRYIQFNLLDPDHPKYNEKEFRVEDYAMRNVKSSNGATEQRFTIRTSLRIFNNTYPIALTLSERSSMKYPLLLGRKFLKKRFLVDSSKKDLSFKSKKNQ